MNARAPLIVCWVLCLSSTLCAQTAFFETEPNDNRSQANPITCMIAGDSIHGTTTGSSTTVAGAASSDNFVVSVCAAPLGIYRHRLTLSSAVLLHSGTLRGFNQSFGTVNTTSDAAFQFASTTSTPPRHVVFDGFGKGERIMYRVQGTAATTAEYAATLTTVPLAPIVVPGTFTGSEITVSTLVQTTIDTEIYLYDANLDPVPTAHNDDVHSVGPMILQSYLTRPVSVGTYYIAIQRFNLSNGTGDLNPDENFLNGPVIEFTGPVACASMVLAADLDFVISDGTISVPVSVVGGGNYETSWATFTVTAPPTLSTFCYGHQNGFGDPGCPCDNDVPAGVPRGCVNSTGNGAMFVGTGNPSISSDTLILTGSDMAPTSFALFLQSDSREGGGLGVLHFFDGLRCVGPSFVRLTTKKSVAGMASIGFPGVAVSTLGNVVVPGAQHYQIVYRNNAGPCNFLANSTNGVSVVWGP